MSMTMTADGKATLVRILPSCGGTMSGMWSVARELGDSDSLDLREILGERLDHPDNAALLELVASCKRNGGPIDLEGVITHFASYEHLHKFDVEATVVAAELSVTTRALAHTLLPLTMIGGKYLYENGDVTLPISGLVQLGSTVGTPYAHLASVIWIEDGGLSVKILESQAQSGVQKRAAGISALDYLQAPKLRQATEAAKQILNM